MTFVRRYRLRYTERLVDRDLIRLKKIVSECRLRVRTALENPGKPLNLNTCPANSPRKLVTLDFIIFFGNFGNYFALATKNV